MFIYSGLYYKLKTDTQGDLICPIFRSNEDLFSTWTVESDPVTLLIEAGSQIQFSSIVDNWTWTESGGIIGNAEFSCAEKFGRPETIIPVFNIVGSENTYPVQYRFADNETNHYRSYELMNNEIGGVFHTVFGRDAYGGLNTAYINFSILCVLIDAENHALIKSGGFSLGQFKPYSTSSTFYETAADWGTHNLSVVNAEITTDTTTTFHTFGPQLEDWLTKTADIMGEARTPENDPFEDVTGGSGTGGGTGTGTLGGGEAVDFPSLPTLSALSTGMVTLYNPTLSQLNSLASYLWNADASTVDFWKKLVANPMDLILGLSIVPVNVYGAGTKHVIVGNIDTGVTMNYTNSQYVEVNCGTLEIPEVWGAYLDFEPYTKFSIYLPYCGTHPIMADEIVGKSISVKYHIDVMSGACCAYVKCGNRVLYQFNGNCSAQIPVTSQQFTGAIQAAFSIAQTSGMLGSMAVSGGLTAPVATASSASIASTAMNLKPTISKSGAISGMGGQLAIQTPYLIIQRPNQCVPANQNQFTGYPSYINTSGSELSGYTEFEIVHLEYVDATGDELSEIERLLKEGVIF